MGQFKVEVDELAQTHLKRHFKSGDKSSIKKIEKILLELSENPYIGIGNPEAMNCQVSGRTE